MSNSSVSKNVATWLFILLSIIYISYSFNLILREYSHNPSDCATPFPLNLTTFPARFSTSPSPTPTPSPTSANTTSAAKSPSPSNHSTKPNAVQKINKPEPKEQTKPIKDCLRETELKHVVFGIAASSNLWDSRKEYIKTWWRPGETRGSVWLDQHVPVDENDTLPDLRISEDTSKFKYSHGIGMRSALRITRVVSEMLKLKMSHVRWFVMGDDDTIFVVDNVVRALAKYDHNQFYYVGSSSESHVQNIIFSYNMAFGGGGFAISYPLAKELSKMQDRCIQRYPALYGSDDRIHACMTELGVPLTKEQGFHQYDVHGDLLGLLSAHPIAPLISLHHLDVVDPIFPGMNRLESLKRLFKAVNVDSSSIIQQSICYDQNRSWSLSVSWGYVVQITRGVMSPRELEMPTRTFLNWYQKADYTAYAINTRPIMKNPCQKPFIFYMNNTWRDETKKQTFSVYLRDPTPAPSCNWTMESPDTVDSILVIKRPDPYRWHKSPRRDCCRVLKSRRQRALNIWVGSCREGEVTEILE